MSAKEIVLKLLSVFYEDVSLGDAIAGIRSVGGIMISNEFSLTHKLYASIPFDSLANLTLLDNVRYVEEISPPVSLQNIDAGKLSNVFWDNNGSITGLFETDFLTGSGVNVAVRDVGKIYNHQDFSGRLTTVDHDFVSSHATHVAGTIGGVLDNDGNIDTGGMAESVNLYSYSLFVVGTFQAVQEIDFTIDFVSAIETYSASIINNSWGSTIGWDYYPNSRGIFVWDWRDTIHLFGKYTSGSEDMDDFMHDYYDNDALILKAAGNERDDEDDDPNDLNNHPHDGEYYSDSEGLYSGYYYCLEPLSCAKNIITIGAVGTDNSENESTSFSSWGPTGDGRVKPDVVADGFELLSTWVDNGYNEDDGTSMACPVVTGISALIFQEYKDSYGSFPTADIVKALLCNYAMDQGNPGPDFSYGFGIVDAKASIECIQNLDGTSGGHIITSSIDETGSSLEYQLTILENDSDNESLRITLCWIDPPGNPQAVNAIVNDLDLVVVDNDGVARYPFYFKEYDASPLPEAEEPTVDPTEPAKIGFNRYDTVEQVIIEADNENRLAPGTYNVRITGFKLPYLNQPFAVVSSVGFHGFHFNTLRIKKIRRRVGNEPSNGF
ncbi:MAG: S8 family serine peptidase [bacterium]|nr:S8 family serine peptidase [bacterium]